MTEPQTDILPDAMLDIETLGTGRDAAIISVGALRFNREWSTLAGAREFYKVVRLDGYVGVIDPATVLWWMKQEAAAREPIFGEVAQIQASELYQVLGGLQLFLAGQGRSNMAERLWSNGPMFDERIVREAGQRLGLALGTHYRAERCMRNVYDDAELFFGKDNAREVLRIAELNRVPIEAKLLPKHHALGDCYVQAAHLLAVHEFKKELTRGAS